MRIQTQPLASEAAVWDPQNPEPFKRLAGAQFLGATADGDFRYRSREGREQVGYLGWWVILPDGSGDGGARFADPTNVGDGEIWGAAG